MQCFNMYCNNIMLKHSNFNNNTGPIWICFVSHVDLFFILFLLITYKIQSWLELTIFHIAEIKAVCVMFLSFYSLKLPLFHPVLN